MSDFDLKRAYSIQGPDGARDLYRDWASSYDNDFGAAYGFVMPREVARIFLAESKGDTPILDVGAGTGLVAAHLGGAEIDGLDISPEMLEVARAQGSVPQSDRSRPHRPPAPTGRHLRRRDLKWHLHPWTRGSWLPPRAPARRETRRPVHLHRRTRRLRQHGIWLVSGTPERAGPHLATPLLRVSDLRGNGPRERRGSRLGDDLPQSLTPKPLASGAPCEAPPRAPEYFKKDEKAALSEVGHPFIFLANTPGEAPAGRRGRSPFFEPLAAASCRSAAN